MNPTTHNSIGPGSVEQTLRLIAGLPAPEGLEERVHEALRRAPRTRRLLSWPAALRPESGWVRAAAAAAIVFVVAGGGWGVYSHVEQGQTARIVVLPPHVPISGGFSSAGAMRTPQTLNGPVVAHPAAKRPTPAETQKKVKTRRTSARVPLAHHAGAGKAATRP
jgi:hypothetical protein